MLNEIQKIEVEVAEKVQRAKVEAATKLQTAKTSAADNLKKLEAALRSEEQQAIAAGDEKAQTESAKVIAEAEKKAQSFSDNAGITEKLAKELISKFI